ncbi:ribosomal RNA methyltransferase MRM2, mitochondrial [Aspergillus udagawae]|uniref:rRNA methyltransferase 2, mitochondrial n=1 Tax=Aspergillus udagawae TaxID=91492 RepID=A0ABQ1BFI9_9EURO|nr:ribosomal RNA methyltransferase MRM2, mitochondrial [Aspergillus udagawae]GFF61920.1 ribosomal RNA methyltransferase MRM2, mitochondrial [Aspergillus udagawae]GFG00314.1 ribosomal RNA methyltransferase MRM2, mitochondrial [Aspergillus udagawae]GFG19460.1 ribosomal RNA methyltransferase MRM2, mitochondrial [Aspergillus udagawae]
MFFLSRPTKIIRLEINDITSLLIFKRHSSSKRWQARQFKDHFTRAAAVQGLKSRAAFKLLQIDEKYHIFKSGQTVVDLGYAPGSWSQVAATRTQPNGRVLGVDIIPAQPPRGVSTIQGNFLAPDIQAYVREFLRDPCRGRPRSPGPWDGDEHNNTTLSSTTSLEHKSKCIGTNTGNLPQSDVASERTVDVVLSDMMMNTSGVNFRDHAGSMDLCRAALQFSFDTLRTGGHLICKFYQGVEDKELERQFKALFHRVHRIKPESSRNESREAYFVGLDRRNNASKNEVLMQS